METAKTILDVLKKNNKPMKAGEIATATGIDKKEVDKALKQLMNDTKIFSPQRCYYDLKK